MYTTNIITKQVFISPSELSVDIDDTLLKKIKDEIGDKCIRYGYVDKSSIKIIKRSLGQLLTNFLNGDINYIVKFSANICNPPKNFKIEAKVKNVNKMGLILEKGPLTIFVARQLNKDKTIFTNTNLNKIISVVIKGSNFQLNAKQIICVGVVYDSSMDDQIITELDTSSQELDLEDEEEDQEIDPDNESGDDSDEEDLISEEEADDKEADEEQDDEVVEGVEEDESGDDDDDKDIN